MHSLRSLAQVVSDTQTQTLLVTDDVLMAYAFCILLKYICSKHHQCIITTVIIIIVVMIIITTIIVFCCYYYYCYGYCCCYYCGD